MIQGELQHKWNRVAWAIACLILIQTKAPQNNKILRECSRCKVSSCHVCPVLRGQIRPLAKGSADCYVKSILTRIGSQILQSASIIAPKKLYAQLFSSASFR